MPYTLKPPSIDTKWTKIAIIAILLMLEPMLVKLYDVVSLNRWPTQFEAAGFVILGVIQIVTYLLTFLKNEAA
jgi:heme/copper-type cytochrome/quinol oxidase subunit 4